MTTIPEILPAGSWERGVKRPKGVLTAGGNRKMNEIFPFKLGWNLDYTIRKYRHTSQAFDWTSVKKALEGKVPPLSVARCFEHAKSLDAAGAEALRKTGSYGRRNVYTDHARQWIKAATTMIWLKNGGDVEGGASWPPKAKLKGAKFRRIYHPWSSSNIIWIDGFGNHIPDTFGGAVGDDSKIIATWEELLETGGYAEGDSLILPTGTREGAEAIRAYNEKGGVEKPKPEPKPEPKPGIDLDAIIKECEGHVSYFKAKGHSAAKRWEKVIGRLQGVTANSGNVSDAALASWLRLSRANNWADGKATLPKVIEALK